MAFSFKNFISRFSSKESISAPRRSLGFAAGSVVSEDSAMQVSALYRGLMYISSQIAKLPWEVKDRQNKQIEDNVSYLIGLRPNPEMNAMSFRLVMIQQAILSGNSYAEIERDLTGRPVNLWPIPSANVEVKRTPDGSLVYEVKASSSYSSNGPVYLRPNDMFHVKNFHTKDGIVGQGVISYGMAVLGIALGADRMAGNLFANGGLPSGVLEAPGTLGDEAFLRLKKSWDEAHTGKKTGGIAILEEGLKYNSVMMQPDVMQFLESREFNVLEIARFLGLPPTKLYDIKASTYSNQEQSNLEVATDTIDSWCRALEMEADIKLLNSRYGGKRTEFDLYEIFRGDMTTRSNYFGKMMQVAAMSPNEIRIREGMSPYSDGDRLYIANNNYAPVDRIDEIIDSQINSDTSSTPTDKVVENDDDTIPSPAAMDDELSKAVIKYLGK